MTKPDLGRPLAPSWEGKGQGHTTTSRKANTPKCSTIQESCLPAAQKAHEMPGDLGFSSQPSLAKE